MISAVGLLAIVVFLGVFAALFGSALLSFFRIRGMANKVFTLAEQEMDRKLSEGPAKPIAAVADPEVCSHCGSRVPAKIAQCPNCGAGLP